MAYKEQRRAGRVPSHPANVSNRQSFDRELPVDLHERPVNYLTETEVRRLIEGAKTSRNPERDALLITMLFYHGLRESEARLLRRDALKLDAAKVWVGRVKGGRACEHPIPGDELRLIRRYLRSRQDDLPWLFISERLQPLSDRSVRVIVANAAKAARLPHVHPHMLRHSCGFYLHNRGQNSRLIQDYLGHANPASTMLYTRTASKQFEGLFD
jgi:type 1 fimbriae regulatory protein FimB